MKVLVVVADRALVRQSFAHLLSGRPQIRVAGGAARVEDLRRLVTKTAPDVVILDACATAARTIAAVRDIRAKSRCRIIVTGPYPEIAFRSAVLGAGASAYLGPERSEVDLVHEIESRSEPRYDEPAATEGRGAAEGLSGREFDVLRLMGSGLVGRGVAQALGISPKTVSTYRSRILAKLGLANTAEIVKYAVEHGLGERPHPD